MRERMLGKTLSLETRQKQSLAHKGKVFSAEHRANMSRARRLMLARKAEKCS